VQQENVGRLLPGPILATTLASTEFTAWPSEAGGSLTTSCKYPYYFVAANELFGQ